VPRIIKALENEQRVKHLHSKATLNIHLVLLDLHCKSKQLLEIYPLSGLLAKCIFF
jgi:hypothetical protein